MSDASAKKVDVRPSGLRFRTRTDWLDSRHSFSFGGHYDPANTHFGLLLVNNDDIVQPGAGFANHPHRDTEIVTWVLRGALRHEDAQGNSGVIYPGLAQAMSAGTGISHSEVNGAASDGDQVPVRFVQMWVVPDTIGLTPSYQQADVGAEMETGELVPIAAGPGRRRRCEAALTIRQEAAALHAARLPPAATATLADAPYLHVYVAGGAVGLEGVGELAEGDAARLVGYGGLLASARDGGAEILVWAMHDAI